MSWADHPQGWRIVEDVTCVPLVLDEIIEAEGGLVHDLEMRHGGCSKRKRSLKGADSAAPRSYQPSAAERGGCHGGKEAQGATQEGRSNVTMYDN